jgi:integrase
VFLYKRVLTHNLDGRINAVRADKKSHVPVVMTREEVAAIMSLMDRTAPLVAKLLYGSGLRIMEAIRLRVQDIDFQMKQLTVRSGKGDRDRFTTFPDTLTPLLQNHLAGSGRAAPTGSSFRAMARSTCPTHWSGSIPTPPRSGAGSMSSPPGTSPSPLVLVAHDVIMLIPASSTKPSR